MKVLITGGTGFLGRRLATVLRQQGNEVTVLGRNRSVGKGLAAEGLRFIAADLRDEAAIAAACDGQDCVFHSGALSSPWGKEQDFYDSNVLGTRHVVAGCLTAGVSRLVHVSTSAVYFTYADQLQIHESRPFPTPVNAYAKTKQMAEQEIAKGYEQGLSTIIIRPRGIFGPGDTTILPRLLRASDRTGIPLICGGSAQIDMTYIDNVVEALCCAQHAPSTTFGRAYNISNGEPKSLISLLTMLSQQVGFPLNYKPLPYWLANGVAAAMEGGARLLAGKEPTMTRYTVGLLAFSQTLDIRAAQTELNYQPSVELTEGISRFAQWWKANSVRSA